MKVGMGTVEKRTLENIGIALGIHKARDTHAHLGVINLLPP